MPKKNSKSNKILSREKSFLSWLLSLLDHSFFVTVLGGVIITCMGAFFQDRFAIHEEKLLKEEQTYTRKYNLYLQFSTKFYKRVEITKNLILLRLKRKNITGSPINFNDPVYQEYLDLHKRIANLHRSLDSEFILLGQVKIMFKSSQVLFYARNLEFIIQALFTDERFKKNTYSKKEVNYYFDIILTFFEILLKEMGREINCETVIK